MTNSSKECQWVTCLEHLAQTGTDSFNYSFTNCSILWFKITNLWFKKSVCLHVWKYEVCKKGSCCGFIFARNNIRSCISTTSKEGKYFGGFKICLNWLLNVKTLITPSIALSWFDKNSSDKMLPLPFFKSKMHETCTPTIIYFKSWTFDKLRISQQEARARLQSCMIILSKMWEKNSSHPELFDPRAKAHNEPGLGSHCIKRNGTHFTWRKQTMSLSW